MVKRALNLTFVVFHLDKSEYFSVILSCASCQRYAASSGWKFQLNNLAVKGSKQDKTI